MNAFEFLKRLFGGKPKDALIGTFELPSAKARNFASIEDAAKHIEGRDPYHSDVYFQCGIMAPGSDRHRRGKTEAVIGIPGFWMDMDCGDHGKGQNYPPDLASVEEIIAESPLPPSLIIKTGGGLHAYWRFDEPWIFKNPQEKARAERGCKGLQAALRGIAAKKGGWTFDSTADLVRILRVPGTFNNKPGRGHAKVEVLAENPRRYNPDDFDPFMVEDAAPDPAQEPPKERLLEIAQGLKADRRAEPPKEKFDQLMAENERFRLSWEADKRGTEGWSGSTPSNFAMSLADHAARAGWSDQEIADLIIAFYRKHRSTKAFKNSTSMKKATRIDYLARTIAKARASVARTNEILEYLRLNEDGDAWLFKREHKNKFAFDHGEGSWYKYRGHCWEKDKLKDSLEAVGRIAALYAAESRRHAGGLAKELKKRGFDLGGHDRRTRVLKLAAAGEGRLGVSGDDWDRQPYLLPCANGVVDLRTGALAPGRPELFIRNFCPVEYDPAAGPPARLLQALMDYFDRDQQMIDYLQRLFGLVLIGEFLEPVFPILYGPRGQNGKGTILEVFGTILGPYLAGPVSTELLLEQDRNNRRGAPSPEIMSLQGRRLAWASEVNRGRSFDLSMVKRLTGGDTLRARNLHGNEVQFPPTHTLFLVSNVLPDARLDSAYLHREQVIEFKYSYVDDPDPDDPFQRKADRQFKKDLLRESAQFLRWAVQGSVLYLANGLSPPEALRCARPVQVNSVDEFVKSRIEACPGGRVGKTEAFEAYVIYCTENHRRPATQRTFARAMISKYEDGRVPDFRFYKNIRLIPRAAQQPGAADEAGPVKRQAASG